VLIFGAGPEAVPLLPLLAGLGWRVELREPREAWRRRVVGVASPAPPPGATGASAAHGAGLERFDAALVMHHNFELDREALQHLAASTIAFVGLLGPERRREDLFKLLRAELRAALLPRLRSPIGLPLGGRGPEAIALSIAAQLQAWRHGIAAEYR
jgi:xanthine dehydrogenase accessory factor